MARILLIEDDAAIIEAMKIALEGEGHFVYACTKAKEWVKIIHTIRPHLIFIDMFIDGVKGDMVVKKLKEDAQTVSIPVVMVSAHTSIQQIAIQSGADGYLEKPFELDALFDSVRRFTSLKKK